jgi:uncharacterized membrane protein YidH (DUF202 family)
VVVVSLLSLLMGAGVGFGLLLVVTGLRPPPKAQEAPTPPRWPDLDRRLLRAAIAGGAVFLLMRWPVPALAAAVLAFFFTDLFGAKAAREAAQALTEAIASWTEMLRDIVVAAHGLEEAIEVSADIAPVPIRGQVVTLAGQARRGRLVPALSEFGAELAHPLGDLVVLALRQAAEGRGVELGPTLAALALTAREDAAMRQRVETRRAHVRTAVRIIIGATVAMVAFVVFLNRRYLHAYGTHTGQVVLAVVIAFGGVALWWLAAMGRYESPERFLVGASTAEAEERW